MAYKSASTERQMETVVIFRVSLSYGGWRSTGVTSVTLVVDGVDTSSQAIDKAIAMVKVLREDKPSQVTATMDSYEREIPRQIEGERIE